jgi:hypothetical protein
VGAGVGCFVGGLGGAVVAGVDCGEELGSDMSSDGATLSWIRPSTFGIAVTQSGQTSISTAP